MAFEAEPRPEITQDTENVRQRPRIGSLTTVFNWSARVLGWLFGDAAMLGVVTWSSHLFGAQLARYLFSVTLIALGAYFLFGYPQLRLWNRERGKQTVGRNAPSDDPRMNFARSLLDKGGVPLFFAASILEGPLLVGWWAGRVNHRHQVLLTWASSWILALAWAGVYLVFSIWALAVVFLAVVGFAVYQALKMKRG